VFPSLDVEEIDIKAGKTLVQAELADSFLSRARGLSFRTSGKMLFAFPRPTGAKIDMMFLSDPLHLYFMNSEKKVVDIQKAAPWSWNPKTWKLYSPDCKYSYLLESFEKLDVEEGDKLEFTI
jgi:uncharacterized membrane protein (UPF0127 family)